MSKRCQWMPRVLGSVEWHKGHVTSVGKTLLGTWLRLFFKQWGEMKKMWRDDNNARKTSSIVEDIFWGS
jgi:trehalose utilization protein